MKLTKPKSGFGSLIKGDEIFIIGGNDSENVLSVCE